MCAVSQPGTGLGENILKVITYAYPARVDVTIRWLSSSRNRLLFMHTGSLKTVFSRARPPLILGKVNLVGKTPRCLSVQFQCYEDIYVAILQVISSPPFL